MEYDQENIISLDLPQREGRSITGLFLRYFSVFGTLICDTKSDTDYRINMFTNLMVNSIPDDDIRDRMKELKKALIAKNIEVLGGNRDVSERNRAVVDACFEVVGEIAGYMDTHLGTTKKLAVTTECVYPEDYYKVSKCSK